MRLSSLSLLAVWAIIASSAGAQEYLPRSRHGRLLRPAGPRRPTAGELETPSAAADGDLLQLSPPPAAEQLQQPAPVVRRRLVRVNRRRGGRRPGATSRAAQEQPYLQLPEQDSYPAEQSEAVTELPLELALEQGREARSPQYLQPQSRLRQDRAFSLGAGNRLTAQRGPGGGFPVLPARHQPQLQYIGVPAPRAEPEQYRSSPDPRDEPVQYRGAPYEPEPQPQPEQPEHRRGSSRFQFEPIPYDESDGGEQIGDGLEEVEEGPDPLSELLSKSTFKCAASDNGYFADDSVDCKAFHYCSGGVKHSWTCPDGMIFHQINLICMPMSSDNICKRSSDFHFVNDYLYKELNETIGGKPLYARRYSPDSFDALGLYSDPAPQTTVPGFSNELGAGESTVTPDPHGLQTGGFSTGAPSRASYEAAGVSRNPARPLRRPASAARAPNRLDAGPSVNPAGVDRFSGGRGSVRRFQRPVPERDFAEDISTPSGPPNSPPGIALGRPQRGFKPLNAPSKTVPGKSSQEYAPGALYNLDPAIAHINALTADFGGSGQPFRTQPSHSDFEGAQSLPGSRFSSSSFPGFPAGDFSSLGSPALRPGLKRGASGLDLNSQTPSLDAGIFTQHGPASGAQTSGRGFSRPTLDFGPQAPSSQGGPASAAPGRPGSHQRASAAGGRLSLLALGADGIRLSGSPPPGQNPAVRGGHSGAVGGSAAASAATPSAGQGPALGLFSASSPLTHGQISGDNSVGGFGGFSRGATGLSGDFSQAGQGSFTESGLGSSGFGPAPRYF